MMGRTKMEILNCLKTNNETIEVTFLACDPSPLEEGSRDGYTAKMLSTRLCPMETRKKVISENGMQHWIRNNLAEILNTAFLHDLTLGLGTRPSLPLDTTQQLQKGVVQVSSGVCRLSCIRTHALFSFPNLPVSQGGGKHCLRWERWVAMLRH